jgi:hypothetical protein
LTSAIFTFVSTFFAGGAKASFGADYAEFSNCLTLTTIDGPYYSICFVSNFYSTGN